MPYNSKDPEFEKRFEAYVESLQKVANSKGGRLIFEEEEKAGAQAKKGDISIHRDRVPTDADFARIDGFVDVKANVWLVGIDRERAKTDTPQKFTWVISSKDNGKTWGARTFIGRGNFPSIASTAANELLIFSTETSNQFGYQGQWPEDGTPIGPDRPNAYHWPGRGTLIVQRSKDNGKSWSKPQLVVKDNQVIQSRAYVGPDRRIWLVYVQSDPFPMDNRRTSLWLTSSKDNGQTWAKPQRLTDGKYLDREPDLIVRDGKLLVAFSRTGRGINTNIWVAEIDKKD